MNDRERQPHSSGNVHPETINRSRAWRRFRRHRSAWAALVLLGLILLGCVATLPISLREYARQDLDMNRHPPRVTGIISTREGFAPFGYDVLGRNLFWRCMLGGVLSLGIGVAAAVISVVIGTTWGLLAGWYGGRVDNLMMRLVDLLYGLPYVLLVILLKMAFEPKLVTVLNSMFGPGHDQAANVMILFLAIGGVSWLTMARVIRGQVLALKGQPFLEAARALGLPTRRILFRHVLPNLVGPIIVYATLTVPQAILQESFLSFLGIGVQAPLPTWGSLAAEGVKAVNTVVSFWWLVFFPSLLLGVTLLCLNFIGDGLRDAFDPRAGVEKVVG